MLDGLSLDTHFGNMVALLVCAVAISIVLFKFYKEGIYSRAGLIAGQVGLWGAVAFMFFTLN